MRKKHRLYESVPVRSCNPTSDTVNMVRVSHWQNHVSTEATTGISGEFRNEEVDKFQDLL